MRLGARHLNLPLLLATTAFLACSDQTPTEPAGPDIDLVTQWAKGGGGGKPNPSLAGNNLSFPVIWAEGVAKTPPGTSGMEPLLTGTWSYQWGTNGVDPDVTPASCPPDPDEGDEILNVDGLPLCDDGVPGAVDLGLEAGLAGADNPLPLARAYVQKDPGNQWQAASWPLPFGTAPSGPVNIDLIDWGDNLESVDWYTQSQVRTEVVLFEDAIAGDAEGHGWPVPPAGEAAASEYEMRHTSGWGIDEVHGLAATLGGTAMQGPGTMATVYSTCARFTIQRLLADRGDAELADLIWVPGEGWTEPEGYEDDLISPPIFNGAVHEASDGPGFYNAEINVKGRIIFGYTWNVRRLNEGAGDYRLTFSFDDACGGKTLNTFFVGTTEIMIPLDEVTTAIAAEEGEEPGGGGTGVLDTQLNLTFMDISILERGGGGGGGKGGGKKK